MFSPLAKCIVGLPEDVDLSPAQVVRVVGGTPLLMINGVPFFELHGIESTKRVLKIYVLEPSPGNTKGLDRTPLTLDTIREGIRQLSMLFTVPTGIPIETVLVPRP